MGGVTTFTVKSQPELSVNKVRRMERQLIDLERRNIILEQVVAKIEYTLKEAYRDYKNEMDD